MPDEKWRYEFLKRREYIVIKKGVPVCVILGRTYYKWPSTLRKGNVRAPKTEGARVTKNGEREYIVTQKDVPVGVILLSTTYYEWEGKSQLQHKKRGHKSRVLKKRGQSEEYEVEMW